MKTALTGFVITASASSLRKIKCDEKWLISRLDKKTEGVKWVPQLAPTWDLNTMCLGQWKELPEYEWWPKYQNEYNKQFKSEEMLVELRKIWTLVKAGKTIALLCTCKEDTYCHRNLIAKFLRNYGIKVLEFLDENDFNGDRFDPEERQKMLPWCNLAYERQEIGDYNIAIDLYDVITNYMPTELDAWLNKGYCLYKLKQYEESIEIYNKLIKSYPNDILVYYYKVLLLISMDRFDEAIETFLISMTLQPVEHNIEHIRFFIGDRYYQTIVAFEKIKGCTSKIEMQYLKGCILQLLDMNDEAAEQFELVLNYGSEPSADDHEVAQAWFNKGKSKQESGKPEEALKAFKKAIQLKNDYADAYFEIGYIEFWMLNNLESAEAAFDMATNIEKDHLAAWFAKGRLLFAKKEYEKAIVACYRVIESETDAYRAWDMIGDCHYELENYEEALEAYLKVINYQPSSMFSEQTFINIGNCLSRVGDYNAAINIYDKVIDYNAENSEAWLNMSDTYVKSGNLTKAFYAYDMAIKNQVTLAEANYNRGVKFSESRQYSEALEAFLLTIKIDSNYILAWYGAACMYDKLKEVKKASEYLEKAIKLNIENRSKLLLSH